MSREDKSSHLASQLLKIYAANYAGTETQPRQQTLGYRGGELDDLNPPLPTFIPTNAALTDADLINRIRNCSEYTPGGELGKLKGWLKARTSPDLKEMGTEENWNSLLRACLTQVWYILQPDYDKRHNNKRPIFRRQDFDAIHPRTMCQLAVLIVKTYVTQKINKRVIDTLRTMQAYNDAIQLEAEQKSFQQNIWLQQRLYLLQKEENVVEQDLKEKISDAQQELDANTQAFEGRVRILEVELKKKTAELAQLGADKESFETMCPATSMGESPSSASDSIDSVSLQKLIAETQRRRDAVSEENRAAVLRDQERRRQVDQLESGARRGAEGAMSYWRQLESINQGRVPLAREPHLPSR
mgnify:CR=1 FL=1